MPNDEPAISSTTELPTPGPVETDAPGWIAAEHGALREQFDVYRRLLENDGSGGERQTLARRICDAMVVHTACEEELFYPALQKELGASELVDEAIAEHVEMKSLIARLQSMEPDDVAYDATVALLGEHFQRHAAEEEREILPSLRQASIDLDALAQQLADRKAALVAEITSPD